MVELHFRGILRHIFHGQDEQCSTMALWPDPGPNNQQVCTALAQALRRQGLSEVLVLDVNGRHLVRVELTGDDHKSLDYLDGFRTDPVCNLFDCKRKAKSKKVRHKIDSIAHSIDFGPEFTISIDLELPDVATPTLPGFPAV